MSLRKKLLLIICITLLGLIAAFYITSKNYLLNSYIDLEEQYTQQNIRLLKGIISNRVDHLKTLAAEWANRNDTNNFMIDHNSDYLQDNFHASDFINSDFNFVLLVDPSGSVIFNKGFDLINKTEIPVPDNLLRQITPDSILLNFDETNQSVTGLISSPVAPMIVASCPISDSNYRGPRHGTLIMGRYLDAAEINHLSEISHLTLTLHDVHDKKLPFDEQAVFDSLSWENPVVVQPLSKASVAGYTLIYDVFENPSILMKVQLERKIFQRGLASVSYFMYSFLLAALVVIFLSVVFLEKTILSRLSYLSNKVGNISSRISGRIDITGKDELSKLAGSINHMLDELEHYHSQLKISESQLQRITDNMLDIVTQASVNGIIEYVSPSGKTVFGYEAEDQLGQSIFDYIHPDHMESVLTTFQTAVTTGFSVRTEHCRLHADGHYVWMETLGNPIFDHDGEVTGIILVSREIAQRKMAEKALLKVHEELETRVAERTESLVKANDQLKNEIIERERIQEALQYQLKFEQLIAAISTDFIKIDTEDIDLSIHQALQTIGEFVRVDRSYIFLFDENGTMSNTHEWCAEGIQLQIDNLQKIPVSSVPWWMSKLKRFENIYIPRIENLPPEAALEKELLQDQAIQSLVVVPIIYGKSLLGYLGFDWVREEKSNFQEHITLLRVTAEILANALTRQHSEEALAAEKTRLDVSLRNISDGVITVDMEKRIILINNAAADIIGWNTEDAVGRFINEVFYIIDKKTNQKVLDAADILLGKPKTDHTDHTTLISKDGTRKIIDHKSNQLKDKDNNVFGFVLVFGDVTEQKKYDAQLALSQKMESIGQLAAGIAHEINTPMQYIGDNNRFLRDAFQDICDYLNQNLNDFITDPHTRENLEYLISEIPQAIDQSLEGIAQVTELILAMKNFTHPGIKEKMSADINKGIEGTIKISRNEWKYVAGLDMDLDPYLPPVNCVIDEINQVILNMIVNAAHAVKEAVERDYYPKGNIYISTREKSDEIEITISDNGVGIPEDLLHRVFDPFFTTKDVGKGTGQGLAIAHDIIVNKHQGSIRVESREGVGTTFIIRLPLNCD